MLLKYMNKMAEQIILQSKSQFWGMMFPWVWESQNSHTNFGRIFSVYQFPSMFCSVHSLMYVDYYAFVKFGIYKMPHIFILWWWLLLEHLTLMYMNETIPCKNANFDCRILLFVYSSITLLYLWKQWCWYSKKMN